MVRAVVLLPLVVLWALVPVAAVAEPVSPPGPALWVAPLPAVSVTRPFDLLPHRYAAGHRGVDLAGAPGTPVLAAGDGVVAFAGMIAGRPVVSVDHPGGLRTTYEPVDPSVGAGQRVVRGSPLGTLLAGHAGCPASACLHWGLRRRDDYLDPLNLLAPPRVRLLPLYRARRRSQRTDRRPTARSRAAVHSSRDREPVDRAPALPDADPARGVLGTAGTPPAPGEGGGCRHADRGRGRGRGAPRRRDVVRHDGAGARVPARRP